MKKKILLFMFGCILLIGLVSAWTVGLNDGLQHYYDFNEVSGNLLDKVSTVNGTPTGTTQNVAGVINNSYDFPSGNSVGIDFSSAGINNFFPQTVNFWVNPDSVSDGSAYNFISTGTTLNSFAFTYLDTEICANKPTVGGWCSSGAGLTTGWSMVTINATSSAFSVWINGTYKTTRAIGSGTLGTAVNHQLIGARPSDFSPLIRESLNGKLDEFGIWNKHLNQTEITELFNSGSGTAYTTEFYANPPEVTLNFPTNIYKTSDATINFNVTVTDDWTLNNVTLYIDGILNETNTSGVEGEYIFTKILSEAVHNWSILAYDNDSNANQTVTWTFQIDEFPSINITKPTPSESFTTTSIPLNATVTDANGIKNCSYWVMRGASQEIARTDVDNYTGNFYNDTMVVSGDATYNLWVECFDQNNNSNSTTLSFVKTTTALIGGGGGGGGANILEKLAPPKDSICKKYQEAWVIAWENSKTMSNAEKIKSLKNPLLDHLLCKSSASIVPI